ncbi:MAG: hypothetical protein EA379_08925 [Phycisphaerales bacterium]|nr:MAG: hypothetical protein EA379_08925 [Phycisphaerales bacterium]
MPLIIDAFNALHATGAMPRGLSPDLSPSDESDLARLVAASKWRTGQTTIVCDGTGGGRAGPDLRKNVEGVEIVYAGPGRDADSLIARMIEADTSPRKLVVVSSDRAIQKAARRRRAVAMSSEAFLGTLAPVAPPAPAAHTSPMRDAVPLDPHGVARWMREFGYDASTVARAAGSAKGVPRAIDSRGDGKAPTPRAAAVTPAHADHAPKPPKRATEKRPGADRNTKRSAANHKHHPNDPAPAPSPSPTSPLPKGDADPVLDNLLRDWASHLNRDDLDMRKWINGVEPI